MAEAIIYPPILNERLKNLRKEFGYSYKKLEDLTGISRSSLQRYETNPKADIPLNKLTILAKTYDVSVAYLLGTESRDMPYEYFQSISPLLKELNCEIHYDEHGKSYELFIKKRSSENSFCSLPISNEQIKHLKETTLSFLGFKINELIDSYVKPPTTK